MAYALRDKSTGKFFRGELNYTERWVEQRRVSILNKFHWVDITESRMWVSISLPTATAECNKLKVLGINAEVVELKFTEVNNVICTTR